MMLILSFHHIGTREWTHAARLGSSFEPSLQYLWIAALLFTCHIMEHREFSQQMAGVVGTTQPLESDHSMESRLILGLHC